MVHCYSHVHVHVGVLVTPSTIVSMTVLVHTCICTMYIILCMYMYSHSLTMQLQSPERLQFLYDVLLKNDPGSVGRLRVALKIATALGRDTSLVHLCNISGVSKLYCAELHRQCTCTCTLYMCICTLYCTVYMYMYTSVLQYLCAILFMYSTINMA